MEELLMFSAPLQCSLGRVPPSFLPSEMHSQDQHAVRMSVSVTPTKAFTLCSALGSEEMLNFKPFSTALKLLFFYWAIRSPFAYLT